MSAVEAVGGFAQEKVAADLEISWRLQANGWKIIGREDIVGYHKDPDTLRGIYRWGYTRGQMGFYTRLGYKRKLLHWAQLVRFAPMFLAVLAIWRWRLAVLALLSSLLVFLLYVRKQPASLVDKVTGWLVLMTKMSGWNLGFVREALLHLKKRVVD
jgi:cellulose synthase/poly-beta-1,6-N-acetylglucosamine synthase-like glycosyltransferase